jgi:hypothetical protein
MSDSRTSQLNLPRMPTVYQFLLPNSVLKKWTVPKTSQSIQHLRDSIISKHGDFIYIVKMPIIFAIESGPEICHADLSSLEKADILPVLKTNNVVETGEVLSEDVDKSSSGMVGSLYALYEAAFVFLSITISK